MVMVNISSGFSVKTLVKGKYSQLQKQICIFQEEALAPNVWAPMVTSSLQSDTRRLNRNQLPHVVARPRFGGKSVFGVGDTITSDVMTMQKSPGIEQKV